MTATNIALILIIAFLLLKYGQPNLQHHQGTGTG